MFYPTENTSSPPVYRKFLCCGKPEQSVLIGGDICGFSYTQLEKWLKPFSPVPFRHIVKKLQNGYGHLHFDTQMEAAQFYHEMNGRLFDAPEGRDGNVKFSHALYFNSKRPVEYGKALGVATTKRERATMTSLMAEEVTGNSPKRPRDSKESATRELGEDSKTGSKYEFNKGSKSLKQSQNSKADVTYDLPEGILGSSTEQPQDNKTDVAYRLYEDSQAFCIVLLTPGIKDKTEFEIAVADDDQFISIKGKFANNSASGKLIIDSIPSGPFQAEIPLPGKIDISCNVDVRIEHGVTRMFLRKAQARIAKKTVLQIV
ncbi:10571_t:CDS:2 [Ambispora leptoticha]|uniref:10571_t:CDS:1 n=1 Tax=Ambispora leptoticha TaxID=144679 RepID=A0A9N9BT21_9GLOM|nr:10571_t:CDS:2 [Ambispora leptoticha]